MTFDLVPDPKVNLTLHTTPNVEAALKCKTQISDKVRQIYSRAMKTQHPNIHQYLKDILNILSQRISDDFTNTIDRHDIDFIRFSMKCSNVYTHAHFPTVV